MKINLGIFFGILLFTSHIVVAQDSVSSGKSLSIFTLGDSNGSFPYSWPVQIQSAISNARVLNISKPGRTIGFVNNGDSTLNSLLVLDENLKNAASFIDDKKFDYIVIELGTNDAKAVFANRQNEVGPNLDKLIKKIKECSYESISRAKLIIISPPPYGSKAEATEKYKGGNERVKNMSKAFEEVAKQNNCLFVNGYTIPGLDMETMTIDGLHLDPVASKKLIGPIVKLINQTRM